MGLYEEIQLQKRIKELESLLTAVLSHTGRITLTEEEAVKVWSNATLKSETPLEGGITLWVEGTH